MARARWTCLTALALGVSLFTGRPATAQSTTGTISGTVVDESSQSVPGASVTLVHEQTAVARTEVTTARGAFQFTAVPPGLYTVRVELTGFRTVEKTRNVLTVSGQLDVGRIVLGVGAITEVITVATEGTHVETTNSDHAGLLTATQISQIQTQGRDVMSLLRLVPGVRYEADIEAMGDSFGSNVPNVAGQRRAWNQVTVDGLNGNEMSGTSRFSSAINLDAIAEVKVLLNTYRAEFGRSGGANIQIVSKGGSSNYQGSGYWYGRRDAWNSNRWENIRDGAPKPKQHIDTYGFNLGGPLQIPGLLEQGADKKLFFFYSLEAPQVERPGPLRRFRMPTDRERQGDFSQTFDTNGQLVVIRDPVTLQPFPGNIIPQDRMDANGRRLIDMLPRPNSLDHNATSQWNFVRQETSRNPRWNNLLRIDAKPSNVTSLWGTYRTFSSNQYGSEITAGPAKWGFFDGAYIFSDDSINGGHTRIFSSSVVNEIQIGIRRQTEGFDTRSDSDWSRLRRSDIGYTLGQFNAQLNPDGIIPRATFELASTGVDSPDFTYDQRLGATAEDWLFSIRQNLTWTKGSHTFKGGGYFESMRNNEARGGPWMGEFRFRRDAQNPLDTNHAFSNALLGVFSEYTETDQYRETKNKAWMAEWYAQDTWRAHERLTIDYGVRFLWYTPYWREDNRVSNFDPSSYDRAQAPRLYQPATINGRRMAFDPVTGVSLPPVYIGAFVPGTGNETNGMVLATDSGVPRGFRDRLAPEIEPRAGFAWDVFGTGKTALRASAGLFHNARLGGGSLGNMASNPPFIHTPIVYYGTMNTLFEPGSRLTSRPSALEALEGEAKTPRSYNWSVGVQQDIGWGTVVDVTYIGTLGRNLEMYTSINPVPDGARFLDLHPENRDPTSATAALPSDFLRPYLGYQDIRVRGNSGTSNYHALQLQANRRYVAGVQVGAAYTFGKALGVADEDPGNISASVARPQRSWLYGPLVQSQTHTLVVNYTWDLPSVSRFWKNAAARLLLDGWQLSGENAFASGDWAPIILTTNDAFDFTGGDGGLTGTAANSDLGGGFRVVRPDVVGDWRAGNRDPLTGWFNTDAFARPSGRGDYGDAPRNAVQRPGVNNWNLAAFKNFGLGGSRRLQFRIEAYNVLNTIQFSDIDRTARFDRDGRQTNPNFGIATTSRAPRTMQLSVRVNF